MNEQTIKTFKKQIELHRDSLDISDFEVDLIYDAVCALINMGANDAIIEIWFKGLEYEIGVVQKKLQEIENKAILK